MSYRFHVHDGPGDGAWHVRRAHWIEALSQPYELNIDLAIADADLDLDEMLGASCSLELERALGHGRVIHGVVRRVDWLGHGVEQLLLRVQVVPALAMLEQRIDSRIFQDLTVPEILKAVLEPALGEWSRELDADTKLTGSYAPRDYCVQFRESDLAFARRLMEQEGIAFCFEQDTDAHVEKLVLVDDNAGYTEVPLVEGSEVPIITDRPDTADRESLQHIGWRRSERTSVVARRSFNWKSPDTVAELVERNDAHRGRAREHYQHDARRHVVDARDDDGFDGTTEQLALPVRDDRERLMQESAGADGGSNVIGMVPGRTFVVGGHALAQLDGVKMLLVRVVHTGECADEEIGAELDSGVRYANRFECRPVEQPFRPTPQIVKPRVYGPLTARVTGPAGEEIHTDRFGRIKIKLHWDRISSDDETSSCWVRVAQMWAGPGWGTVFLPRIGMEVVVQFIDGDPDQPLVVGCVYNGTNGVPYTLPDDKTKSTIKTRSTPGSDGFNELRFEDAAGSEEIYVHAQKDLVEQVLNDHTLTVDANETLTVGGNQVVKIKGNRLVEISGEPDPSDNGDNTGGSTFKGSSTAVTGDYKCTASATAYISAPDSITLECPGSSIKLEPGKITLTAGGGATIVLDANALMKSAAGAQVLLDGNALVQSVAGSKVLLDGNALTQSSAGSKVLLDGNALTEAAAGGSVMLDANATMTGATTTAGSTSGGQVVLTADAKLEGATTTCVGAGGSVKLGGGAAEIKGGSVTSAADGVNTITGATVALN